MKPMTRRSQGTEDAKISTRVDSLERRHYEINGFYEIKLWADPGHPLAVSNPEISIIQDGVASFEFPIRRDLAIRKLVEAEAGISVACSGPLTIDIRNLGVSKAGNVAMMTDPIVIDAGDFVSEVSGSPSEVDESNNEVDLGEWIAIDVDGSDGVAAGLCIYLRFD